MRSSSTTADWINVANNNIEVFKVNSNGSLFCLQNSTANTWFGLEAMGLATAAVNCTAFGYQALKCTTAVQTAPVGLVAIGTRALAAVNNTGVRNVAVGFEALTTLTTGFDCTAVGHSALKSLNVGQYCTAVGSGALEFATNTTFNVAVGYYSQRGLQTGSMNVSVGGHALQIGTGGSQNTAIGTNSFRNGSDWIMNTGCGISTGSFLNGTGYNTCLGAYAAVGGSAVSAAITCNSVTAVGAFAGYFCYQSTNNIFVGANNGPKNSASALTGALNIIIGSNIAAPTTASPVPSGSWTGAGCDLTATSNRNIFIGSDSYTAGSADQSNSIRIGFSTTTDTRIAGISGASVGSSLPVFVSSTGMLGTTSTGTLSIGNGGTGAAALGDKGVVVVNGASLTSVEPTATSSGVLISANAATPTWLNAVNTAVNVGQILLSAGSSASTAPNLQWITVFAANDNIRFGVNALPAVTAGARNIAFGTDSLVSNTTGNNNIAIGMDCLKLATTPQWNIAIGNFALSKKTTLGGSNVAIGNACFLMATTGERNTGIGDNVGFSITTGSYNVGVGSQSLNVLTTGNRNVCVGQLAGEKMDTSGANVPDNNIALGFNAGKELTSGSFNISLSSDSFGHGTTGASNLLLIGNTVTNVTKIAGIRDVVPSAGASICVIDSTSQVTSLANGTVAQYLRSDGTSISWQSGFGDFVNLTTAQTAAGAKTFSSPMVLSGSAGIQLSVFGPPVASAVSSLVQIGDVMAGGNGNGTWLSMRSSSTTADWINVANNNIEVFKVNSNGSISGTSSTAVDHNWSGTGDVALRLTSTSAVGNLCSLQLTAVGNTLLALDADSANTSGELAQPSIRMSCDALSTQFQLFIDNPGTYISNATCFVAYSSTYPLMRFGAGTTTLGPPVVVNTPAFSLNVGWNTVNCIAPGTAGAAALSVTGLPTNVATLASFRIGNAIASGNVAADGGTFFGMNAPASGAGSAADLVNLQGNNVSRFRLTASGDVTMPAVFSKAVSGVALMIDGTGLIGTVASSRRYKDNIVPLSDFSSRILQLNPVRFVYKASGCGDWGLIAEDVADVIPEIVVFVDVMEESEQVVSCRVDDGDGHCVERDVVRLVKTQVLDVDGSVLRRPETVQYLRLIPLLLNELIRLTHRVAVLEAAVGV